jgi:uncharacterized membrane protein
VKDYQEVRLESFLRSIGWVGLGLISALGAAGVAIFGSIGLGKVNSTFMSPILYRVCLG